ncbi:MAG: YitT family protein, partial [Dorea sp.]|nr:YitT family protein [Dorea sp.]
VVAMIMKKYTSFNIGNALLVTDLFITVAGFFVFDIQTGLYSFLGLALRSFMIDGFIESLNLSKYFNVVCKNPQPICNFIKDEMHRSATIVQAKGAFSGEDKYIIFTVMNRMEAVRLRNYIKEHSPDAFLLISNTSEIIGKGFHSI